MRISNNNNTVRVVEPENRVICFCKALLANNDDCVVGDNEDKHNNILPLSMTRQRRNRTSFIDSLRHYGHMQSVGGTIRRQRRPRRCGRWTRFNETLLIIIKHIIVVGVRCVMIIYGVIGMAHRQMAVFTEKQMISGGDGVHARSSVALSSARHC